jgi:urease accessory protein
MVAGISITVIARMHQRSIAPANVAIIRMTDGLAPDATPLTEPALLALLQLTSPSLPVGAYSYSQGLEAALAADLPGDRARIAEWITDHLELVIARCEAPLLLRLHRAWRTNDYAGAARWNEFFLSTRDTAEFRAETLQMGHSAARLLAQLDAARPEALEFLLGLPPTFPASFAFAASAWDIPERAMVVGYLWTWSENQVLAALKAAPLGQAAGQSMLRTIAARIPSIAEHAMTLADDEITSFAPGLSIASYRHEMLAGRIFRS